MSLASLTVAVALAAYAAAGTLLSLLVAGAWSASLARRPAGAAPPDGPSRGRTLFVLRLLPALGATLAVSAVVLPAFLLFEPPGTREPPGWPLVLAAGAGALFLAVGSARGLRAWRTTRRLARAWRSRAEPLRLPGAPAPAYVFDHGFPAVSLVGVRRARLFVARGVVAALEPGELRAVLAHEAAHLAARDNLRALLLRGCPDLLALLPIGARLTRAWTRAVEAAADDHAAGADPARALDLAAALVKIGRLAPPGARLPLPVSAIDGDAGGLAERVERLLDRAHDTGAAAPAVQAATGFVRWAMATTALSVAVAALVAQVDVLRAVHTALEHAVNFLR